MATPYQTPLKPEHCACLDKVLTETPGKLQLAKDCCEDGLPAQDFVDQLQAQLDTAQRLKARHFPNRS